MKQFLTVAFASVICIVSSTEPTGWSYASVVHQLPYFNSLTPASLGPVQDVAFRPESRVPNKADQETLLVLGSHVRCLKELQALKERLDGTTDCTASDLKKEFLEISKRLAETNAIVLNLKKEMTEMSRHSTETWQRLAETNADVLNLKKTLNASVVELTATKNNLMDMTAAFADLEKESERHSGGLENANAKIEVLKTELKTTTTDLAALKLFSDNVTTSLESVDANFVAIQQDLNATKADVIALKATSSSDNKPSSIGKIPASCADLRQLGNGKSGLYNVKSDKKIKITYCDFTKPSTDAGFQNSIGFLDVKSSTPTSFYVQLGKDFSEARSPIPFVKELLNVGGAYNRTNRKFTAPVTGKYFFTLTGVVAFPATMSNISYLQLALYKNGGEIGRAFSDEMSDARKHGTISLQSTLDLIKGDQIWPMISFIAPSVYLVGHGYTHYSGFLLDEDIMS